MKRNEFDRIIVGGGFSGLIAALVSASTGKRTAILTKGAGTLTIGGGIVDLLGYIDKTPLGYPFDGIDKLNADHPYRIAGDDMIRRALTFFEELTCAAGYPYEARDGKNSWLPTAIGTLKPTYLRPAGMNPTTLETDNIYIVGVAGLKDFYPELIAKGLPEQPGYKLKNFATVKLPFDYERGRDLNALDIARFVDLKKGRRWLLDALKHFVPRNCSVIMPPILGTRPESKIQEEISAELGIECMETSLMPPSVTGLRLRALLMDKIKEHNITYIEMADVVRADVEGKRCRAVYTKAADKERAYAAEDFIIATGGFFGGGCVAAPGRAFEPIFDINIAAPARQEEWSENRLFSEKPHPFGLMGVSVSESFNPLSPDGEILLENVRFAGRTLAGYDLNREKSGNGVALVTGYTAAIR